MSHNTAVHVRNPAARRAAFDGANCDAAVAVGAAPGHRFRRGDAGRWDTQQEQDGGTIRNRTVGPSGTGRCGDAAFCGQKILLVSTLFR